jgi:hypothetical protein
MRHSILSSTATASSTLPRSAASYNQAVASSPSRWEAATILNSTRRSVWNPSSSIAPWTNLEQARELLEAAGLTITRAEEAFPRTRYLDVGAIVLQLRAVPWQVPGFDVDRHRQRLQAIHNQIIQHGAFTVTSHRLLLEATRN